MRHRSYSPGDDQPILVGDVGWRGVDLRREPHQLEEGLGSWAVNTRFLAGAPEDRLGTAVVNWTMKLVDAEVVPFDTIYGVGVFRDPITQRVYQITAAAEGVYAATESNPPGAVPMPSGVSITDRVTFTQCFNVLIMFRGRSLAPLQMASINLGFTEIPQTEAGTGTLPTPKGERGTFFSNRLIVPFGNDEVAISDFQDYTRYEPTRNAGKINQGSADRLVAVVKFNDTTLVAFKGHSIFALYNVFGDLGTMQMDEVTREFGLVAPGSIAQVGSDLWFLSELGVMSITQTEQNKLQGVVLPVSTPINPLIQRINWRYAQNATGAYNDNKYYLAVPVDAAEILHDEAIPPAVTYRSDGSYPLPLVPGATYRLVIGSADEVAVDTNDGFTSIFYTSSGDVTLVATSLILSGPAGAPITTSVRRVVKGVNNILLVYDFLNGAWSGYDEVPELDFKELFVMPYARKERLWVATSTGHIFLYEEHADDAMVFPYTEVRALILPEVGDTIQVNGGKLVAAAANDFNGGLSWGIGSPPDLALARTNLWSDAGALGGYHTGTADFWDYGGAAAYPVTDGVRFRSLDGKQPKVETTGAWAQVDVARRREIDTWFITGGKSGPNGALWRPQWLRLDVQTQGANYSVNVLTEGVAESEAAVVDSTRSRTRYQEHGKAEWDPTNINDDFMTPGREDYSVFPGAEGIYLQEGIRMDLHQESRQEKQVGVVVGRAPRIEVRKTQGRLRVMGVSLEGVPDRPGEGIWI